MLQSENWKEFHIRHWTGKAAFVAAFRRPLFAILESVFPCIRDSVQADVRPGWKEAEEILSFMILADRGQNFHYQKAVLEGPGELNFNKKSAFPNRA